MILSDADQKGIAASLAYVAKNHPNANVPELSGLAARVGSTCWDYYCKVMGADTRVNP